MEIKNLEDIVQSIESASLSDKEIAINQLNLIISQLPIEISSLIENAFVNKRIPKEFLFSSILFAYSNAAGLAFKISALGYNNFANLFFALIGNRGDVKSVGMKLATELFKQYDKDSYNEENTDELENIKKRKFLIQNATIQAAQYSHYHNKYSIGVFIDELTFLIEKMASKNNSDGMAWRSFFLEGYNNDVIDVLRRSSGSYRLEKSFPTLIGSIQEQFVPNLFGNGNLESGFIDRILFTTKLTSNSKSSRQEIPHNLISDYEESLKNVIEFRRLIEDNTEIDDVLLTMESDAEKALSDYVQKLIDEQEHAAINIKEYLSKLQISIHKLLIIAHLIKNATDSSFEKTINLETLKLAITFNDFYYTNFKIINSQNKKVNSKPLDIEKVIESAIKNGATQKDVVAVTGLSKATISRKWNVCLNSMKLETNT